jgi:hypothetical protein
MIYFIKDEVCPSIKIGYSVDPKKRLKRLQTANCNRLVIYGMIPGTIREEKMLHYRYQFSAIRGEWYNLTPDEQSEVDRMISCQSIYLPETQRCLFVSEPTLFANSVTREAIIEIVPCCSFYCIACLRMPDNEETRRYHELRRKLIGHQFAPRREEVRVERLAAMEVPR